MRRGRGQAPLSDFGLYHYALEPFDEVHPESLEDLHALVAGARQERRPLRFRGSGHSLNGASVPKPGELLVRTDALRHFRAESPGTLTVGAGVTMWDVRDFAAEHGWRLPVYNNGSAGPTVGGFVAAGGLGPDSVEFGGLWDNVAGIVAVDGRGERVVLGERDEELRWWFGAMGRLGVLFEATLQLVPLAGVTPRPFPASGTMPRLHRVAAPVYTPPGAPSGESLAYWVTVLTPTGREAEALADLDALRARHERALEWLPIFTYRMVHRGRVAPLVWARSEDFLALFLWGKISVSDPAARGHVEAIEQDFVELVHAKGYSRYHQTELVGPTFDHARYYGPETWAQIVELRQRRDPDRILNPGALGMP